MTSLEVLELIDVSATSVCNFKSGIPIELVDYKMEEIQCYRKRWTGFETAVT